jgi:hypothetical protein
MVNDLIEVAFTGLVAMVLLWLAPRSASRSWAVGLLAFG